MIAKDALGKIMNLPLEKLKFITHTERQEVDKLIFEFTFQGKGKYKICPHCKRKTKDRYDQTLYPQRNIHHQVIFPHHIRLTLLKRRFYCHHCKQDFIEPFDFLPPPGPLSWEEFKKK